MVWYDAARRRSRSATAGLGANFQITKLDPNYQNDAHDQMTQMTKITKATQTTKMTQMT